MLEWVWFISLSFCGVILRLKKGDDGHYWFASYGLMVLAVILNSGHVLWAAEVLQTNLPQSGEPINTLTAWIFVVAGCVFWILTPTIWVRLTGQNQQQIRSVTLPPTPHENKSLEAIQFERDHCELLVCKNAISTLALLHAASEEKIIECLSGYLWDEDELKALQSLYASGTHDS